MTDDSYYMRVVSRNKKKVVVLIESCQYNLKKLRGLSMQLEDYRRIRNSMPDADGRFQYDPLKLKEIIANRCPHDAKKALEKKLEESFAEIISGEEVVENDLSATSIDLDPKSS